MTIDIQTDHPGIIIRFRKPDESVHFERLVKDALAKIASQNRGRNLIQQIVALKSREKFGYTVCIMRPDGLSIDIPKKGKESEWSGSSFAVRSHEQNACNGTGCVTKVIWNANVIKTPDGSRPSFIALAHELVHALYNLKGEGKLETSAEEYRTVGLPPVADAREFTENKIRAEHGVPLRAKYEDLAPPPMI